VYKKVLIDIDGDDVEDRIEMLTNSEELTNSKDELQKQYLKDLLPTDNPKEAFLKAILNYIKSAFEEAAVRIQTTQREHSARTQTPTGNPQEGNTSAQLPAPPAPPAQNAEGALTRPDPTLQEVKLFIQNNVNEFEKIPDTASDKNDYRLININGNKLITALCPGAGYDNGNGTYSHILVALIRKKLEKS
jgi:DNA-binding phage protein